MSAPTRFTELVACAWPVQLAAMAGGVGGPVLAAAVQEVGGLGMVSWGEEIPPGCGINFIVAYRPSAEVVREAAGRARVVEFFYDDPDRELVDAAHGPGAIAGWQVGSVNEAVAAEAVGCDYVVAQGTEAGGHVRGRSSLDDLLPAVLARVTVPVVAAGGIATAERVAALLGTGADGVRVGTRFLTCPESGAHDQYVQSLLAASSEDTALTEWFDEGWPHAPHRVLAGALEAAKHSGWRGVGPPHRAVDRNPADMAQYAGTGVGDVTAVEPAAEVVADLVRLLPGTV
ncbi:MAG: NAD(P)H-dependent flavin oxidoreductase [Acidimicrobiales bacterium]